MLHCVIHGACFLLPRSHGLCALSLKTPLCLGSAELGDGNCNCYPRLVGKGKKRELPVLLLA